MEYLLSFFALFLYNRALNNNIRIFPAAVHAISLEKYAKLRKKCKKVGTFRKISLDFLRFPNGGM